MSKISIFTDGSSRGNPGPGGWGAVIVKFKIQNEKLKVEESSDGEVFELGGREENTTNNRMELSAVIGALAFISSSQLQTPDSQLRIFTDSSYVLNGATKWVKNWQSRGWKTIDKKDVLNKDLWEKLTDVMEDKDISWKLLSGHVGIAGNERADIIATDFADGKKPELFNGNMADYAIKNILDINHDELKKAEKKSSKNRSSAKAYSYLSMVGGEIKTHQSWNECEARVKGVKGALFKKSLSAEEENSIIEDWKKRN